MELKTGTGTPVQPPNPFRMGENHPKDERLRKNIEKLVQVCTDRLNRDSNHSRALYIRASCLMRLGELDKALEDCSSYLRILSKEGFNDLSAIDGLYLRGCIFQRKGQIKQAIVDFSTVLESEPNHFNARLGRASCYNYLGEFDLAIQDYEGGLLGDSTREKLNMSKRLRDSRSYQDERDKHNLVPLAPQQAGIMSILAPVEGELADEGILPLMDLRSKNKSTKQLISTGSATAQKPGASNSNGLQKTPSKAPLAKQPKEVANPVDAAGRSPNGRSNSKGASYAGLPFSGSKQRPSATGGDLELSTHSEAEKYDECSYRWYKLGSQLRKSLRYPEAISHYTKAIELSPNHTRAIFNRGFVFDKLGRFKEAIEDYTECIKLEPLNSFAWYNKGISLNNIMDFEGACQCFSKAIQIDASNADFYHNRGYALRKLQDYRRALADFDLALQLNPSHFRALFNRVYCYERLGDFDLALRDIKRCRDLEPQNHDVVLSLATLLTRKADRDSLEQAESYLLQLLSEKIDEQDPVLINSLATIYEKQKRYELALKYFTQACHLAAPHINPVYENNRACALRDVGRVQESLEVFADLVESDPTNPRYYSNIGLLYRRIGELDKAIEIYTKEIACTKTPHPSAWTKRAYCYAKAGYIEQAIEDYSQAISIEAMNTHSLFNRGLCLQKVGKLAEAVKDFSIVLQLEPNHISAYYSRAGCLDAMGRVDEAVADYSKAMGLEEEAQRASHGANPHQVQVQQEADLRKARVTNKPS